LKVKEYFKDKKLKVKSKGFIKVNGKDEFLMSFVVFRVPIANNLKLLWNLWIL
jgi:hypothetical protein